MQLNALVVYTIDMPLAPFESPPPLVTLKMSHLFVAPPSGTSLSEMRTIDLPVHGRLALGPGDLGAGGGVLWPMPFIGRTTPVSDLDSSNVVSLQKAPGGFIVRGNVSGVRLLSLALACLQHRRISHSQSEILLCTTRQVKQCNGECSVLRMGWTWLEGFAAADGPVP